MSGQGCMAVTSLQPFQTPHLKMYDCQVSPSSLPWKSSSGRATKRPSPLSPTPVICLNRPYLRVCMWVRPLHALNLNSHQHYANCCLTTGEQARMHSRREGTAAWSPCQAFRCHLWLAAQSLDAVRHFSKDKQPFLQSLPQLLNSDWSNAYILTLQHVHVVCSRSIMS